jgi:hypothetical protein
MQSANGPSQKLKGIDFALLLNGFSFCDTGLRRGWRRPIEL